MISASVAVALCALLLTATAGLMTFAVAPLVALDQIRAEIMRCAIVHRNYLHEHRGAPATPRPGEMEVCIQTLIDHEQISRVLKFVFYQLPLLRWRMQVAAALVSLPALLVALLVFLHVRVEGWEAASPMTNAALLVAVGGVFTTFVVAFLLFLFGQRATDLRDELARLRQPADGPIVDLR